MQAQIVLISPGSSWVDIEKVLKAGEIKEVSLLLHPSVKAFCPSSNFGSGLSGLGIKLKHGCCITIALITPLVYTLVKEVGM